MKKLKGSIETIIAAIFLIALVVALIGTVVVKLTNSGERNIDRSIEELSDQQVKMQRY